MRPAFCPIAAAALALAVLAPLPAAAQAVAQAVDRREGIEQAIAGAALLGLFALALRGDHEEDNEDNDDEARDDRARNASPAGDGHRRNWSPPGHRRNWSPDRHGWERERDRAALPASCLRQHDTARGAVQLFGGDCLEDRYRGRRDLPFDCAILLDARGRLVSGYVPRCLSAHGFEFADR